MVIGVIGAGASGMAAALAAADNPNAEVLLFERQARVGRKLQATGNGRCNITNLHACSGGYHGENSDFAQPALQLMTPEKTLAWFQTLGLLTIAEDSGRVYPYSNQANSVVDVLRFALNKSNIQLLLGNEVQKIHTDISGFTIITQTNQYNCDKVIVACGGLAGTALGGSMSGYKLLTKLGHKTTRLRPALVQLKSEWSGVAALKGVRTNCRAQIFHNKCLYAESSGELQFTEYGISGPVVFEISRDVCQSPGEWICKLDFLPHISEDELFQFLTGRKNKNLLAEELLTGILHNRLGRTLIKDASIRRDIRIGDLSEQQLRDVCRCVKAFDISISGQLGMDAAQVTAGGVFTKDFDPRTMESSLIKGLYACGEVLDIDGDCGGYNLQWAWSSGWCAGLNAGKDMQ